MTVQKERRFDDPVDAATDAILLLESADHLCVPGTAGLIVVHHQHSPGILGMLLQKILETLDEPTEGFFGGIDSGRKMALVDRLAEKRHPTAVIAHQLERSPVEIVPLTSGQVDIGLGPPERFLLPLDLVFWFGRPDLQPMLRPPFKHGVVTCAPAQLLERRNQRLFMKRPQHPGGMELQLIHGPIQSVEPLQAADTLGESEPGTDMNGHADHDVVAGLGGVPVRNAGFVDVQKEHDAADYDIR